MAAIPGIDRIAAKWATVTPQRSADYEQGVKEPVRDWKAATVASNDAWKAGIQAAMSANSFVKGVDRAGTATWQEGAVSKGVSRWGPGVALAQDKYGSGFSPYRDAISRVTLPPRYARRDPRNLERVRVVVEALKKVKEGMGR